MRKNDRCCDMVLNGKAGDMLDTNKQKALKRKGILKAIAELSLLDDNLMTLVFDRNIEATELLLNVILQRNDLKVLEVVGQREYKNPMSGGRSITIDIYAVDGNGKVYDVEVQHAPEGADPHRARFHSSMVDTKMLKAGQKFKEIHDSYVIFITASDVMGAGRALYHVNRVIEETGTYFGDGSHIIYVNGSYKDDNDPVGRLMHDFRCLSSADMFYPVLARAVEYFKETEGGREVVCQIFEDLAEKWVIEEKKESARRMIASGKLTEEEIAEYAGLPVEEVRELAGVQLA
nr:PD-(D/E)XK nuclease family transposase [uncultured Acetatifactor sp.]